MEQSVGQVVALVGVLLVVGGRLGRRRQAHQRNGVARQRPGACAAAPLSGSFQAVRLFGAVSHAKQPMDTDINHRGTPQYQYQKCFLLYEEILLFLLP